MDAGRTCATVELHDPHGVIVSRPSARRRSDLWYQIDSPGLSGVADKGRACKQGKGRQAAVSANHHGFLPNEILMGLLEYRMTENLNSN